MRRVKLLQRADPIGVGLVLQNAYAERINPITGSRCWSWDQSGSLMSDVVVHASSVLALVATRFVAVSGTASLLLCSDALAAIHNPSTASRAATATLVPHLACSTSRGGTLIGKDEGTEKKKTDARVAQHKRKEQDEPTNPNEIYAKEYQRLLSTTVA